MRNLFYRLRYYLTDYRVLAAVALVSAVALGWLGQGGIRTLGIIVLGLLVLAAMAWSATWLFRRIQGRRRARGLDAMVEDEAGPAAASGSRIDARADTAALRERMLEAVKAIKSSRIGLLKGRAALYELPWYVIIGNPAAGKSSAITNSGLKFPFEDGGGSAVQGVGGTRNCDWYFTTEGIVLDTAGRYSVSVEDRLEWLTFLDLLKKHRPRAPVNGIIIAASIAELSGSRPEFGIELARSLRQRVQEITERLEVIAPVYVVFTKADLIAGFAEFFRGLDPAEREGVWGATLPFDPEGQGDALAAFDSHFDELAEGLREMGLAQMAMARGRDVPPGLLTLPLEFAGIRPALRTFIATLFEDNPYQYPPVFRGFYFTSALQEGDSVQHASERVGKGFGLQPAPGGEPREPAGRDAHFLRDLFRKVVFADRDLVRQYSSPHRTRLRHAVFLGAVATLALVLGLWAWSWTSNRQLVENAARDLAQAVRLQEDRVDLGSRIEALLLIQDRLEQLARHRRERGVAARLGLHQGGRVEARLLEEYFGGMRQVMLAPTVAGIESYLGEVVESGGALSRAAPQAGGEAPSLYQEASPTDADDAYSALKAYLMLGDPARVEQAHLAHQLTRFWRGWLDANRGQMSREDAARAAERLMAFHVARAGEPGWPRIQTRVSLVNDARASLARATRGEPAISRVYAQVKARAATRFPTVTVGALVGERQGDDLVTGSYAISGAFTREAWEDYVRGAIAEAAQGELSTADWVLDTTARSDLSLAGSPEHIAREMEALYRREYASEWQRFLQGVAVAPFASFDDAVARMNVLGDPRDSPLRALLEAVNVQTIWDNSAALHAQQPPQSGFMAWFRRVVLRRGSAAPAAGSGPGPAGQAPMGAVGQAFEGFARLVVPRDGGGALIDGYFQALGALRSRLNAIRTEGEPGPGASRLMRDTLGNEGSELNAALALVDEQLVTGLDEAQRGALRSLLLRPLTETFAALVPPTEDEVNRTWAAQVHGPYVEGIGRRYPFDPGADVDAAAAEIARIFGPSGAVAQFNRDVLGTLVIQRGNLLEPRRWAGLGVTLAPELVAGYGDWVSGSQAGAAGEAITIFQIRPEPAVGAIEYTIAIDGQELRYRNTPPVWESFQWPNPGAVPGATITAVTGDGRTVDVLDAPGVNGFARMMQAARVQQRDDSSTLTWSAHNVSVTVDMRTQGQVGGGGDWQRGLRLPETVAGRATGAPAVAGDAHQGQTQDAEDGA